MTITICAPSLRLGYAPTDPQFPAPLSIANAFAFKLDHRGTINSRWSRPFFERDFSVFWAFAAVYCSSRLIAIHSPPPPPRQQVPSPKKVFLWYRKPPTNLNLDASQRPNSNSSQLAAEFFHFPPPLPMESASNLTETGSPSPAHPLFGVAANLAVLLLWFEITHSKCIIALVLN